MVPPLITSHHRESISLAVGELSSVTVSKQSHEYVLYNQLPLRPFSGRRDQIVQTVRQEEVSLGMLDPKTGR